MGKGLALQAREMYPDLYYHYKKLCRQRQFGLNSIAIYQPTGAPYKVALVPTKAFWGNPSSVEIVDRSLRNLRRVLDVKKFSLVTLPALGCGEGGLSWRKVKPLIDSRLSGLHDTTIYIALNSDQI